MLMGRLRSKTSVRVLAFLATLGYIKGPSLFCSFLLDLKCSVIPKNDGGAQAYGGSAPTRASLVALYAYECVSVIGALKCASYANGEYAKRAIAIALMALVRVRAQRTQRGRANKTSFFLLTILYARLLPFR